MTRGTRFNWILALFAVTGCATFRPNPERLACNDKCTEKKNACMVAATTPDAVSTCDADFQSCMTPCLAMPNRIRVKEK